MAASVNTTDVACRKLTVINPYSGAVLGEVSAASKEEVDAAVATAVQAQKAWAETPAFERSEVLKRFVALLERDREKLAQTLTAEVGKPINESRGELSCAGDTFLSFAEKSRHLYDEIIPAGCEPGTEKTVLMAVREPLGVIACVIPFNFPCWSFSVKTAAALAAGNAVIVKPSSDAPLTILKMGKLMAEAGLPEGVLQVITGGGATAGSWLCGHKDVHGITLTGSTAVGVQTAKAGAEHLAHVTLELGGNDAFIVLNDADISLAVDQAMGGRMSNNGQICCAPKRFLIHKDVKAAFTQELVKRVSALRRGDPADPDSQISCLISEKAAQEVERQVAHTIAQGATLLCGGKREGSYYAPTILTDVTPDMDIAKNLEIFGPVVPIIEISNLDEALRIANDSDYGLGASIFTADMKKAVKAAKALQAGGVVINGSSYFSTVEMAFGGYKHSGIGREGVSISFDDVTQIKTIVLKNIF